MPVHVDHFAQHHLKERRRELGSSLAVGVSKAQHHMAGMAANADCKAA
jgi:hypothetical protein